MPTKISLRKANALQVNINDLLKSIQVKSQIELNEFQDLIPCLQSANDTVMAADVRRSDLLMSVYSIRATVGMANFQCGIGNRLSNLAYIDKRLAQLQDLTSETSLMQDVAVLTGKLEKIKNRREDNRMYGREDTVTTGVLQQQQIDSISAIMRDLKKQKQKLNDEVLELNIKTEIELTSDVEAVLLKEGIL